ncbi:MAG: type III pantothenate kinase [Steroidobacteraceae bacterium]
MKSERPRRSLLIDVGNSRVKWALARGSRIERQHALPIGAAGHVPVPELLAALPKHVDAIRMVSVGRPSRTRALERDLRRAFGVAVTRLRTTAQAAGVRCGYREPWRLGADRWAAVIGAHHLHAPARAACVVDIGTAMTIDFVSRDGKHGGGVIVPGPGLMVEALLRDTQGIRRRAAPGRSGRRTLFATSTHEALVQGSRHAAAALVERAWRAACARYGGRPRLLVTGGGAAQVLALLTVPHALVPDLVLRGLAALD